MKTQVDWKQAWLVLLFVCIGALSSWALSQPMETTVQAKLQWGVETNWTTSPYTMRTLMMWTGDVDPNITTYFEVGTVVSNLYATIEWKGKVHALCLESIPITTLERSYTLKTTTERIYQ